MAPSTVNRPPRWWETAPTPYLVWNKSNKPVKGVKEDGGGSTRGQSRLSDMRMWHAVWARDEQVITALFEGDGADIVNEVDSLGNTPLHLAAFAGDDAIASLLLELGAHVNASNNAGDRPLHWAMAMEHDDMVSLLEAAGAEHTRGQVLVPDNHDKVADFYMRDCWAGHPPPYADFVEHMQHEARREEEAANQLVPGLP